MAIIQDILLGDDGDLIFNDGDLSAGDSTLQHQSLLLLCNKGEFKQHPTRCVGAANYLETADGGALAREIHTDFSLDGMRVNKIRVDIPEIEIEATYGS